MKYSGVITVRPEIIVHVHLSVFAEDEMFFRESCNAIDGFD